MPNKHLEGYPESRTQLCPVEQKRSRTITKILGYLRKGGIKRIPYIKDVQDWPKTSERSEEVKQDVLVELFSKNLLRKCNYRNS